MDEKAIVESIVHRRRFEPFLRNVDKGEQLTSMKLALDRVAEYIELAQDGEHPEVKADIERVLQASPEYLAEMIYGLVLICGSYARARGHSFAPIVRAGAKMLDDDRASHLRVWRE